MTELRDVKRYAVRAAQATTDRDAAIVVARDAGHSLRAIAEAAGITHTGVAKVVARAQQ